MPESCDGQKSSRRCQQAPRISYRCGSSTSTGIVFTRLHDSILQVLLGIGALPVLSPFLGVPFLEEAVEGKNY